MIKIRLSLAIAACLLMSACVSTTTGSSGGDADEADAAGVNFQLGIRYFQNQNFELARDRLLLSIELDPRRPLVWSTLGATYEMLGNPRLAEESYDRAVSLGPRNFEVQNSYAVFLCRQRRFDDAARQFERSIRAATNDNPEVMLTNAGVCLAQKPDTVLAEDYFRRALDARPTHGEALLQLALLKHQTGDDLSARAFLQRFRGAHASNSAALYLCILVENALGDDRARTECANELLENHRDSPEADQFLRSQ